MRKILRWISIVLFALVSMFLIWFGILYASVQDMLWFHAAAVPEAARDEVRSLYFALMNLIGGASAAFGVLSAYTVFMPLRQNVRGAATLLLATHAMAFIMAALTAEQLARATGAPTSWHIMGALLATSLSGFMAHGAAHLACLSGPAVRPK
jgi:hypothetical protein